MPASRRTDQTASVIITVHDRHEYLGDALRSVFAQTVRPEEVIVVDDGSTRRDTITFLESLPARFDVELLRIENKGLPGARNAGRSLATGTAIIFLDDDDEIRPTYLQKSLEILESDMKVGVVYSNAELFGCVEGPWELPPFDARRILLDNMVFAAAVIRTSVFDSVRGFDERLRNGREDHDLWIRMIASGVEFVRLEECLFRYRQTDDSMQHRIGASREAMAATYGHILRNSVDYYAENSEVLWDEIFRLRAENKRYRRRYGLIDDRLKQARTGATKMREHLRARIGRIRRSGDGK